MDHEFSISTPHKFANGDVFLAVASTFVDGGKMKWNVPEMYENVFRMLAGRIDERNYLNANFVTSLENELNDAIISVKKKSNGEWL